MKWKIILKFEEIESVIAMFNCESDAKLLLAKKRENCKNSEITFELRSV